MDRQLFLLDYEDDFDFITQDSLIVKQVLDKNSKKYAYIKMSAADFYCDDHLTLKHKSSFPHTYQNAIPIGSVQFVAAYLRIFFNIEREFSMEIPVVLRKQEYLKRYYEIFAYEQLPVSGSFFIKDVSEHKSFSFIGNIVNFRKLDNLKLINRQHDFLCSEIVNIYSEFRIYVIKGLIKNVCNYKGMPNIFPDMVLINAIIRDLMLYEQRLNSFSLDVMINEKGTSILEMHTFLSLGLFSTRWDSDLIDAYIDNFKFVIDCSNKFTSRN